MFYRKRCFQVLVLASFFVFPAFGHGQDDSMARKLINSQGCKACHTLEGDGGTVSVSFESMRANLSRAETRGKLVNETKRHGNNRIPDFSHLTETEIDALVEFIQPRP